MGRFSYLHQLVQQVRLEVKEHSLLEIFHKDSPRSDLMLDRWAAKDDTVIVTAPPMLMW